MTLWKSTMDEIADAKEKIETAKTLQRNLEGQLHGLEMRRLGEIAKRKCPNCATELAINQLPPPGGQLVHVVDCPTCSRRFQITVRRTGPNQLLDASYEFGGLDMVGWSFEDETPSRLTDDQLAVLVSFISGIPEKARTVQRRDLLRRCLDQQLINLSGTKAGSESE